MWNSYNFSEQSKVNYAFFYLAVAWRLKLNTVFVMDNRRI